MCKCKQDANVKLANKLQETDFPVTIASTKVAGKITRIVMYVSPGSGFISPKYAIKMGKEFLHGPTMDFSATIVKYRNLVA